MKKWFVGVAALAAAMCFGATTEDGVTKERRGALGPNDTVVTDVDATGIVTARTYTKAEVDRRIATNAPVRSVNGKSGAVTLGAGDVGALPNNRTALEGNANFVSAVKNVQIVPTVRKVYTNGTEAVATPDGRIDLALPVAPSSKADRYDPNTEPSHSPFLFPSYYAMWLSFQDIYSWSRDHHRAINDRITMGDSETLAAAKRYTDEHGGGGGGGGGGAVKSVNGKTGDVELDADDVSAYKKINGIDIRTNGYGYYAIDLFNPDTGFGATIDAWEQGGSFSASGIGNSGGVERFDLRYDGFNWTINEDEVTYEYFFPRKSGTMLVDSELEERISPVVNKVKDLHWDPGLEVTWTNIVVNGHIYYVTVTNTNVSTL